jgi:hypothetical protein
MSEGGEEIPVPPFVSLEETRRLAVEATHRAIAIIHAEPELTAAQAGLLRILTAIINDAEDLEIRKFMVRGKLGDRAPAEPDLEGAQRIAGGEGKG